VRERLRDTTIQFVTGELRPPLIGNAGTFEESLRIAGRNASRCGCRRQRILAVRIDGRRIRRMEIRTDGATGEGNQPERDQPAGDQSCQRQRAAMRRDLSYRHDDICLLGDAERRLCVRSYSYDVSKRGISTIPDKFFRVLFLYLLV
jgi:hypothetical protein